MAINGISEVVSRSSEGLQVNNVEWLVSDVKLVVDSLRELTEVEDDLYLKELLSLYSKISSRFSHIVTEGDPERYLASFREELDYFIILLFERPEASKLESWLSQKLINTYDYGEHLYLQESEIYKGSI